MLHISAAARFPKFLLAFQVFSSEMFTRAEAISGLTEKGFNGPIDFLVMRNNAHGKSSFVCGCSSARLRASGYSNK